MSSMEEEVKRLVTYTAQGVDEIEKRVFYVLTDAGHGKQPDALSVNQKATMIALFCGVLTKVLEEKKILTREDSIRLLAAIATNPEIAESLTSDQIEELR